MRINVYRTRQLVYLPFSAAFWCLQHSQWHTWSWSSKVIEWRNEWVGRHCFVAGGLWYKLSLHLHNTQCEHCDWRKWHKNTLLDVLLLHWTCLNDSGAILTDFTCYGSTEKRWHLMVFKLMHIHIDFLYYYN